MEYDSDWEQDVPYIELDLDIKDVYAIYTSLSFMFESGTFKDENEKERTEKLKHFIYRIILEYKFKIGD